MRHQDHGRAGLGAMKWLAGFAVLALLAAFALFSAGAQSATGPAGAATDAREKPARDSSRNTAKAANHKNAREVTYRVQGDQLKGKRVKPKHRRIWDRFIALIPTDARTHLRKFAVFRGGFAGAYVTPVNNPKKWKMGVSQGLSNSRDLDFVLVHEFGHLLTLKASQVPPGSAKQGCTTYFPGEGCATAASYLAQYVAEFWQSTGRLAEWKQETKGGRKGVNQFYNEHRDEFVTSYAPTHPAEDIAESFAAFIVANSPTGATVADEKRRFFERFPELVELRNEVQSANPNDQILARSAARR